MSFKFQWNEVTKYFIQHTIYAYVRVKVSFSWAIVQRKGSSVCSVSIQDQIAIHGVKFFSVDDFVIIHSYSKFHDDRREDTR